MDWREALTSLGVAIGAGLLVGVEREQARMAREQPDLGGIRTFPLIALAGALGSLLVPFAGVWLLAAMGLGIGGILVVAVQGQKPEDRGLTTEVAAIVTFALGALSAAKGILPVPARWLFVAGTAAVVMALLALKSRLHGFASKLSAEDVLATVKFVVLVLVVLPILPDRAFGPFAVLNPFRIGLMTTFVAAISFAGYVAARVVGGAKGFLVTGLLGGLVSSTAVTLTFSGRAKEHADLVLPSAVAILAASSIMFVRVLVIVAVADATLLRSFAAPFGAMAVVASAAAAFSYRASVHRRGQGDVPLKNPFELRRAILFGVFYAGVLFIAKAAQATLGVGGLYGSAALAGLTDVDAITLTAAHLHRGGLEATTAAALVVVAAASNTLVKAGLALVLGGLALGRRVGIGFAAALVAGGAVLLAVR